MGFFYLQPQPACVCTPVGGGQQACHTLEAKGTSPRSRVHWLDGEGIAQDQPWVAFQPVPFPSSGTPAPALSLLQSIYFPSGEISLQGP